ncbi:MAG: hypothetical protein NVSMB21_17130 [Vulcanimicrobiaceae bacterium]
MIARFEGDVEGRPPDVVAAGARIAKGLDFRVRLAANVMEAFAERGRAECDDGADARIRRGATASAQREFAGATEVDAVECGERRAYGATSTPFQKATWSLICLAASLGAG